MDIDRILVELGLHETEAKFYLAALELGQAPVREVARKAGISRTNAYDVFDRLLEQGLVVRVGSPSNKTMVIAAEGPEHLVELFERRRRKLDTILPDLKSLYNRSLAKPRVRFHEGIDGIKLVLNDTLTTRDKKLLGILSMRDLYEVPGREWMDDLVRRRIAAGVSLRVIRSPSKDIANIWPDEPRDLRAVRFAPKDFVFTMTSYIYGEKVALISSRRENFAMTIESEEFAAMQRHLFEVFWAGSLPSRTQARNGRARTSFAEDVKSDALR
jgi:sugar-specific transcriptional regulator TrmB